MASPMRNGLQSRTFFSKLARHLAEADYQLHVITAMDVCGQHPAQLRIIGGSGTCCSHELLPSGLLEVPFAPTTVGTIVIRISVHRRRGAVMAGFVQIIEFKTSRSKEIEELGRIVATADTWIL